MKDDIQLIIEKNLPAQVGEVLKKTLEQAKKDAEKVVLLDKELATIKGTLAKKVKIIEDHTSLDCRNTELNAREKVIAAGEIKLRVNTLEYQLESEKDKTKFSKEVALGLVRNTEFRRELFDNQTNPHTDANGCTQYSNATRNSTETNKSE